jgi:hypothetical protein
MHLYLQDYAINELQANFKPMEQGGKLADGLGFEPR